MKPYYSDVHGDKYKDPCKFQKNNVHLRSFWKYIKLIQKVSENRKRNRVSNI